MDHQVISCSPFLTLEKLLQPTFSLISDIKTFIPEYSIMHYGHSIQHVSIKSGWNYICIHILSSLHFCVFGDLSGFCWCSSLLFGSADQPDCPCCPPMSPEISTKALRTRTPHLKQDTVEQRGLVWWIMLSARRRGNARMFMLTLFWQALLQVHISCGKSSLRLWIDPREVGLISDLCKQQILV